MPARKIPAIRLNQHKRAVLIQFAMNNIRCDNEKREMETTYERAVSAISKAVKKRYPPDDMKLLEKYDCISCTAHISGPSDEHGHLGFQFWVEDKDRYPIVPRYAAYGMKAFRFDKATANAVFAYGLAADKYHNAQKEKQTMYRSLIAASKTFEEVVDVWPAAEQMRDKMYTENRALTILSDDITAAIREDNAGAEQDDEPL